jgi:signal transduction histidine kinase
MGDRQTKKSIWASHRLFNTAVAMVACSLLYYMSVIFSTVGWTSTGYMLDSFHNLYGIDIYGILFFAPVVYVAYVWGVMPSVLTALVTMLVIFPYAILIDDFPSAFFKPTAFAIILSAVGAVVAMLQKSDEQRRRSIQELKCLYDIGKAAEEGTSLENFLPAVLGLIPPAMQHTEETGVRISVRDQVYQTPDYAETAGCATEELVTGDEVIGSLQISCPRNSLRDRHHFIKAVAERLSGAVHGIELEQSLRAYYGQLEEMVDKRTRELEQIQEKLIRSERLAAVGELASGVGHELRNPLNVIRNCAYLLHMSLEDRDGEAKEALQVLDKQIDIANRIVTDLLDFTRIRAPQRTEFPLNSLVKESLSWVVVPAKVKVEADLDGISPSIYADSEQVGRAFANIISNAVQAMNGGGELKISTGTNGTAAWARFEDNGCGISGENQEKIFEPLFTTKPKGIGLGLAITKRLVEQNHGKIQVASQVGQGTTFTINLPLPKERKA